MRRKGNGDASERQRSAGKMDGIGNWQRARREWKRADQRERWVVKYECNDEGVSKWSGRAGICVDVQATDKQELDGPGRQWQSVSEWAGQGRSSGQWAVGWPGCSFLAGAATGALIAFGFWGWLTPFGAQPSSLPEIITNGGKEGLFGAVAPLVRLLPVALITGFLAGFAESIGTSFI